MVSDTLTKARDLISGNGFTAAHYGNDSGQYCMLGAISQVKLGSWKLYRLARSSDEWRHVHIATRELFPYLAGAISYFILELPEQVVAIKGQSAALAIMDRAAALAQAEEKAETERAIIYKARVADEAEMIAQSGHGDVADAEETATEYHGLFARIFG